MFTLPLALIACLTLVAQTSGSRFNREKHPDNQDLSDLQMKIAANAHHVHTKVAGHFHHGSSLRGVARQNRHHHVSLHTKHHAAKLDHGCDERKGIHSHNNSQFPTLDDPCAVAVSDAEEAALIEQESEDVEAGAAEAVEEAEEAEQAVVKEQEAIKSEEASNSAAEAAAENTEQAREEVEEETEEISEEWKEATDEAAEAAQAGDPVEAEEAVDAQTEVKEEVIEQEIAKIKEEQAQDAQAVDNAKAAVADTTEAAAEAAVDTDEQIAEDAQDIADGGVIANGESKAEELEENAGLRKDDMEKAQDAVDNFEAAKEDEDEAEEILDETMDEAKVVKEAKVNSEDSASAIEEAAGTVDVLKEHITCVGCDKRKVTTHEMWGSADASTRSAVKARVSDEAFEKWRLAK